MKRFRAWLASWFQRPPHEHRWDIRMRHGRFQAACACKRMQMLPTFVGLWAEGKTLTDAQLAHEFEENRQRNARIAAEKRRV